jgi:hypothetical protein
MMNEGIITKERSMKTMETVAEFLARGGKVTMAKPMKAHGAQKKQTIKVPARFMGMVK